MNLQLHIKNIAKKYSLYFFYMIIVAIFFSIHLSIEGYLLKNIINILFDSGSTEWPKKLYLYLGYYFFSFLLLIIFYRFFDYIVYVLFLPNVKEYVRVQILKNLFFNNINYFYSHQTGTIVSYIEDLANGTSEIILYSYKFLFYILMVSINIVTLYSIAPSIGYLVGTWLLSYFFIVWIMDKKISSSIDLIEAQKENIKNRLSDTVNNISLVKLFTNEEHEINEVKELILKNKITEKKFEIMYFWIYVVYILGFFISFFLSIFIIISNIYKGILTIGDLSFLINNVLIILNFLWGFGTEYSKFLKELSKIEHALCYLYQKNINNKKEIKITIKNKIIKNSSIQFKNASFGWSENENIFNNINIDIKPNEKIGLVGSSGSGKTTLINLILGFFKLKTGNILLGNELIDEYSEEEIRKNISMVSQDSMIFERSIVENISYGIQNPLIEDVISAAKKASAHDFIMKLSKGYNTVIGKNEAKLSGGQRQRITLARAFLKNAPILILDEATSALDSSTEEKIQKSIFELIKDKTAIIIAHRLSTLKNMDRILVFDKGVILQEGNHQKLITEKGLYREFWNKQTNASIIEETEII